MPLKEGKKKRGREGLRGAGADGVGQRRRADAPEKVVIPSPDYFSFARHVLRNSSCEPSTDATPLLEGGRGAPVRLRPGFSCE